MAFVVADRTQEYTSTAGTGTLTLTGAVSNFGTFSSRIGNGNTTFYTITDNVAQAWEVGVGTVGAGTLSRDTVLSNSLGTTAKINLAGNQSQVFCHYPAEQAILRDPSGNTTALGTVSSGTWQGTTVGVAYGGTGVTASSGANSVVLRDADQNITANNIHLGYTSIVSAAGTTTLTVASSYYQRITGTSTQTIKLPDATTMTNGRAFIIDNDSTQSITIIDAASSTIDTIVSGTIDMVICLDNSTVAGTWIAYGWLPSNYDFGTTSANFGGSTISNAIWNGNTIGSSYGGTGLTTFTAANYALYSTSASTLTAGTLPIAAGGTGQVTANAAFNALAPSQTSNSGKFLTTDGTNTSWATLSADPAGTALFLATMMG